MTPDACQQSPRRAEEQRGLNPLQVLIDNARLAKGERPGRRMTYRRMAELSGLTVGEVRDLCRGPMKTAPPKEQLEGIAKALELELEEVQRVGGATFGWDVYGARNDRVQLVVTSIGKLGDRELAAVEALVEVLLRPAPDARDGRPAGT
jgi:transcriptional regulator with XRE-family HTH domain